MRLHPVATSLLLSLLLAGAAAAAPKPATGLLTNARIAQMLKAGTSEKTIIGMIRRFPDRLDDGPDALVALRRAGASSRLLLELRASVQAAERRRQEGADQAEEAPRQAEAMGTEAGDAPEETPGYGPLSLGLGYPFVALKRDFKDLSLEGRFITRKGIKALALRGYWNYYAVEPLTAYAGLEAGYVRFGLGSHTRSGEELSPFLGLMYSPRRAIGFSADFSPSLLFLPGGGTDSGIGKIGWAVNLGVFIRLPSHAAAAPEETPEAGPAEEAPPREEQPEAAPARRRKAPAAYAAYDENVSEADDAVTARAYFRADKLYAHLLDALPDGDKRRVYLFERRGWLAAKRTDFAAARDLYLKAADAMRGITGYDNTSVRVYAGLGNAFEQLGKDALAVRYYKRALEICTDARQRQQLQARLARLQ